MSENSIQQGAGYALELVKTICDQAGPGLPGTPQEQARAAIIQRELAAQLGAENVQVETFRFAPGAFLGSQGLATVLMLLAALLNWSTGRIPGLPAWSSSAIGLLLAVAALAIFVFEFLLAGELVDGLFRQQTSSNVIGVLRHPAGKAVRRVLIFSGHHDSAREASWMRLTGYGYFVLSMIWLLALLAVAWLNALQLAGVLSGQAWLQQIGSLGWGVSLCLIVPALVYTLFFSRREPAGGVVPGAVDNLSGCATALALCRILVEQPERIPQDAELRFITFGSEEAGVRGARRYVARHAAELHGLQAQLVNFEMLLRPEITILASETNGSVKNAPELVQSLAGAARRAGVPYTVQPATIGTSSDAGPFSRAGLRATTLIGSSMKEMPAFYHQACDTPDVLSLPPLANALAICLEWLEAQG